MRRESFLRAQTTTLHGLHGKTHQRHFERLTVSFLALSLAIYPIARTLSFYFCQLARFRKSVSVAAGDRSLWILPAVLMLLSREFMMLTRLDS